VSDKKVETKSKLEDDVDALFRLSLPLAFKETAQPNVRHASACRQDHGHSSDDTTRNVAH